MKTTLLLWTALTVTHSLAQTMEQSMEKRAREFHRVIGLTDKEQWKKFIQENYTKSLIEKPMRAKTMRQDDQSASSETKDIKGTLEDKIAMLERIHNDFGGSKIASIKPNGENLEMKLDNGDMSGVFNFKFEKEKPYLISGLGISVEAGRR
jgi:hypothetical protein